MKAIGHLSIGYQGAEIEDEFEFDDDISKEKAYEELNEWKNDYIEVWFTDEDGNDIKWKHWPSIPPSAGQPSRLNATICKPLQVLRSVGWMRRREETMNGLKVAISVLVLAMSMAVTSTAEGNDTYIPPEYVQYCEEAGREFCISPEFLESFIEAESSGNPSAANGKCKGLMQVYEAVHREDMSKLGITDIYDPRSNIRLGAYIIVNLFEQYGDDTAKIVMMYNGTSNAKQRAADWNFTDYANKIMNRAYELEDIHGKHSY